MIRTVSAAVISAAILAAAPAFAADLVVDEAAPVDAAAPSSFYATFFAGGALPSSTVQVYENNIMAGVAAEVSYGAGYIVGGALGTTVLDNLRGEVEFSVINSNIDEILGIDITDGVGSMSYNLLANLWYDVDTGSALTPYLGGGAGFGWDVITVDGYDGEINSSGFLYQLGAGVRFAATDNITLDLGYRYRVQPDAEVTSDDISIPDYITVKNDAQTHIVQAGVSLNF